MTAKSVLVCFGEHKRPVSFPVSDARGERKKLEEAIAVTFQDVIGELHPDRSLLLQLKSDGWAGEFVDLSDDAQIPDSSVIRAVNLEPQVNYAL